MLEVTSTERYKRLQNIVNAVVYNHFVNKIGFQGPEENHTCSIDYDHHQDGGEGEDRHGHVCGDVDFGHGVAFNKQISHSTIIQINNYRRPCSREGHYEHEIP